MLYVCQGKKGNIKGNKKNGKGKKKKLEIGIDNGLKRLFSGVKLKYE